MFQHTAARRRLLPIALNRCDDSKVSTHSRPKAAADGNLPRDILAIVSTHSRPKAAADLRLVGQVKTNVSTHSRPKAAAPYIKK